MTKLKINVLMGKTTKEEAIETIRKQLVGSMKKGTVLVFILGKATPNFFSDFCGGPNDFPT